MDAIIEKISAHPDAKSVSNLMELCALAKGLRERADMPAFEKRKRCLCLFETAVGSGKPKLAHIGIEGFQLLLRDSAFNSDTDSGKDEQRTAVQTLSHLASLPTWDRQIQCQAVTVIVNAISNTEVKIFLSDLYAAIQLCANTYKNTDDQSVKLAVRAALTQLLNSFAINRYSNVAPESQEEIVVFMDMTALIKELLTRIDSGQQASPDELQLGLDALYSIVSVQPSHFYKHQPLLNVFTTELIPSLLCLLQFSGEKQEKAKSFLERAKISSAKSQRVTIFSTSDMARSFYQLIEHILKLMAPLQISRSLTVELFRSAMVVPPPEKRYEPLRLLKRFTTTPAFLSSLLTLIALDDAIWPVIVECVEESAKQTASTEVSVDAIRTLQIMFDAFDSISTTFEETNFTKEFFERVKANNEFEAQKNQKIEENEIHEEAPVKKEIIDSAQEFVNRLRVAALEWLKIDNPLELDQKFQKFASDFVTQTSDSPSNANESHQLLNCDAAYICIYASLSLSLRNPENRQTKREFLATFICDGCIVYASDGWLSSVYKILQRQPLFADIELTGKGVLESVVEDYDGFRHKLLIYQSLRSEVAADEGTPPVIIEEREIKSKEMEQIDIWMHRLLSNCWRTIEIILGRFPLKADKKSSEKFSVEGAEATLEAMKSFSRILRHYSMQREVLWLYEKFGEEICNLEELREFIGSSGTEKKSWAMSRVDALGLDLLFENALISGSLSSNCWKYVVRAVEYVAELERHQFCLTKAANTSYETNAEGLKDLLGKPSQKDLSLKTIGKVLDELMLKIHAFFENAARQLNLPSFCSLLDFMVAANESNLKYSDNGRIPETCNLLQRISKLVVASSTRPQIHLMKIWATVCQHFAESSSARFPEEVSRLSVISLGDCIRVLIKEETQGFCFNQGLFGVFQNMLCSDSCGAETQEHIFTILCSFIAEKPQQIGSGWKMLFGAIKAIRIGNVKEKKKSSASPSMVHFAVLEVLKKYFEIDDPKIFVPTALEFLVCVNVYLQSTVETDSQSGESQNNEEREGAIAETILQFVEVCQRLFIEYFDSDDLPSFPPLLHRLKLREKSTDFVEDNYDQRFPDLAPLSTILREEDQLGVFPTDLNHTIKKPLETFPWSTLSQPQQTLSELILTLIESLAGLVLTCSRQIHSRLIAGLSDFISSFQSNSIGSDMGAFALCSLIFPIFQKWVRREKSSGFHLSPESAKSIKSLKQATGIFTEAVVEYIIARPKAEWSERLLLNCLHLLNEFIAHSSQAISGIGAACSRHLIQSISENFTEELWQITSLSLWRTTSITLCPIRRICFHYFSESTDIAGDIGEVSVGIRKEDSERDNAELQVMSRTVFTIDDSASAPIRSRTNTVSMDPESVPQTPSSPLPSSIIPNRQLPYVFKLCKKDSSNPESISLEDIVTSLLNQQVLLQLLSGILLGEQSQILTNGAFNTNSSSTSTAKRSTGFIAKAPPKSIGILLHCLDATSTVAALFDDRPALKTLFQKLCALDQSANLYKYTIASQSIKLISVYEMARAENGEEHLKILERSLYLLLEALKKCDDEAATNKLASFARDRLDQKIKISLVENNEKNTDDLKIFSIVSASKCLEDYKKQKRVDSLPKSRANPFFGKMDSTASAKASINTEKLQLSMLCDLDLKILVYSEIIALCIDRFVSDDDETFARLVKTLSPIITLLIKNATNIRARNCVAHFVSRICSNSQFSTK